MERESALSLAERRVVETEITILAGIFKMPVGIVTGYYNTDPSPPCAALLGTTCNVDFHGRLPFAHLQLRGADGEPTRWATLTKEDFALKRAPEADREAECKKLSSRIIEASGGEIFRH